VQRHDGRDAEGLHEVEDVSAVVAAPDPVLVLDGDDVDAATQVARGPRVVVPLLLPDPMTDLAGI
jgi:hypothetical protein